MKTASQMPSGVLTSVSMTITRCSRSEAVPVAAAVNPAANAMKLRRDRPGDVASLGLRSFLSFGIGGFRLLGWPCHDMVARANDAPSFCGGISSFFFGFASPPGGAGRRPVILRPGRRKNIPDPFLEH